MIDSTTIVIVLSVFPAALAILELRKFIPFKRKKIDKDLNETIVVYQSNRVLPLFVVILIIAFGVLLVQYRIKETDQNYQFEFVKSKLSDINDDIELIKVENSLLLKNKVDAIIEEIVDQ